MLQRLTAEIQRTKADVTACRETARVLISTSLITLIVTVVYLASFV